MQIPTIKIRTDYGRGWAIINKADFDPAKHVAFDDAGGVAATETQVAALRAKLPEQVVAAVRAATTVANAGNLKVGKGPGGRWYVKDGKAIVSGPYDSEGAANAALSNMSA